jgi:hypothetical protein
MTAQARHQNVTWCLVVLYIERPGLSNNRAEAVHQARVMPTARYSL